MITQIISFTIILALLRLVYQSLIYKEIGFKEIPYGFEVGVIGSLLALFMFGHLDFFGVLSIFSYEIYLKIKKQIKG